MAIQVENLGKECRIGGRQRDYHTTRERVQDVALALLRRAGRLLRGEAYDALDILFAMRAPWTRARISSAGMRVGWLGGAARRTVGSRRPSTRDGSGPRETYVREVRLDQEERETLSTLFRMHLGKYPDATVYLFGSRIYPAQRGGDLDLLIVSHRAALHAYELSKELRIAIKERLGDQRVDIVVSPGSQVSGQPAFVRLAFLEGVPIWP